LPTETPCCVQRRAGRNGRLQVVDPDGLLRAARLLMDILSLFLRRVHGQVIDAYALKS
jgi:hypothetical protein